MKKNLIETINKAIEILQVKRDLDSENEKSGLTEHETALLDALNEVWDCCQNVLHAIGTANPTPQSHPHLFDADGDLLPSMESASVITILGKADGEKNTESLFTDAFCKLLNIAKGKGFLQKDIAKMLSVNDHVITDIKNGSRPTTLKLLTLFASQMAYSLVIKIDEQRIDLIPK